LEFLFKLNPLVSEADTPGFENFRIAVHLNIRGNFLASKIKVWQGHEAFESNSLKFRPKALSTRPLAGAGLPRCSFKELRITKKKGLLLMRSVEER
jgi:hypothetical protein